jgi:ATP-dependent helicase/nuclease subunit A
MSEPRLPFDDEPSEAQGFSPALPKPAEIDAFVAQDASPAPRHTLDLVDSAARAYAVNPAENVVLEASAGTGKTRVLVERYVNLLAAGVDPEHILAITFTRKAAAEMRQRIVERLKEASRMSARPSTGAGRPEFTEGRWRDLRGRLGDIAISTIDAFCLALLREFPLEADVDPAFELADETEMPRLIEEALDRSLRICRAMARDDDEVALVFAQLGERRLRQGLAALLNRRLVAPALLRRYLADGPRDLTAAVACRTAAQRLGQLFADLPGGLESFLRCGPLGHPQYALLAADIAALCADSEVVQAFSPARAGLKPCATSGDFDTRAGQAAFRALADRLRAYFLTQDGKPRGERFSGTVFRAAHCDSEAAWKQHRSAASAIAPAIANAVSAFRRDLNVVLSRGVWRMFAVTTAQYRRSLDARALLDFSGVLERAVDLLKQMDEFARSRYRLESRYHHVLVDEFQDTSRAQWDLVEQLIRSWSEGLGASADALPPSIFIVGDRKQAIYGFRDAEVALLEEAAGFIATLRPPLNNGEMTRRALSVSFRSASPLLGFVNDLFGAIEGDQAGRPYAFKYGELDRFPLPLDVPKPGARSLEPDDIPLGLVVGTTVRFAAEAVADEIVRLLNETTVRDKGTGIVRDAQPADLAILFRSRESHREFEAALERRGVPTYVYKGLGFFEADEIQDAVAVLRYLADPTSNLRAAAFLRSRLVRLSDDAILRLAPHLADAIVAEGQENGVVALAAEDRIVLSKVREAVRRWLGLVDRTTPAELLDRVLAESAYGMEIRGPRRLQARENLKKLRGLIRRIQNRGYATLARIADHFERLAVGDESNAAIDAVDAVSLMTVHAAKGLEFPIVFVVNIGRGTGGVRAPIRITSSSDGAPAVAIADFQSEADEETQAREREETKRLLYVALTRARDRLYLSATAEDGTCRTGRGSLGDVLPKSLVDLLAAASGGTEVSRPITWVTSGGEHTFFARRYDPSGEPRRLPPRVMAPTSADDFDPV